MGLVRQSKTFGNTLFRRFIRFYCRKCRRKILDLVDMQKNWEEVPILSMNYMKTPFRKTFIDELL